MNIECVERSCEPEILLTKKKNRTLKILCQKIVSATNRSMSRWSHTWSTGLGRLSMSDETTAYRHSSSPVLIAYKIKVSIRESVLIKQ